MATRVTKTGSTGVEFTTAPQPWQIAELDSDLDQIFANIDNSNVKAGAAIATSKIAADGGVTPGYLAAGAVTTPKIADLSVTTGKLAIGATVDTSTSLAAVGGTITTEAPVVTLPSITVRGTPAKVLLMGTVSMVWLSAASTATARIRVYRQAGAILTIDYAMTAPSGAGAVSIAIPTPQVVDTPIAGTYAYKITAEVIGAGVILVDNTNPGKWFAVELA